MAIEEFTSNGARDFRQRYQNTYGWFTTESKKRILVYMSSVSDTSTEFTDVDGMHYKALADKGVCFEFIPIQKKLFIHKDRIYLASRRPARQWSRGLSSANSTMQSPEVGAIEIDFASVSSYENSKVCTEYKPKTTQLLSSMLGISKNGLLWLYDQNIGMADDNKIQVENHIFYQEVIDTVRARGIDIPVEKA